MMGQLRRVALCIVRSGEPCLLLVLAYAANGNSVFLSPAGHEQKFGCDDYEETANMRLVAESVAGRLRAMGYVVYVGRGTAAQNISTSNALVPDFHVALHSNAGGPCAQTEDGGGGAGTQLYYRVDSPGMQAIAELMLNAIAPSSAVSRNERICLNDGADCNSFVIGEINQVNAPLAYVEAAFHTYQQDMIWLSSIDGPAMAVLAGIDAYFDA
jgi:hypothetical protein